MLSKEAIENVKEQLEGIKKANECGLATRGEFNKDIEAIETVLNLIQTQQAEIEYYKKQKIYDEQFKHELLEEIRCKGLTIDSLNKILDDRLICIQGGRGLYAKLKGLDKEYLIREYLSMYKMCKAEIEKKDKQIEQYQNMLATNDMFNVLEYEKKDKVIDKLATLVFMSRNLTYVDEKQFNVRKREIIEQAEKQVVKEVKRK